MADQVTLSFVNPGTFSMEETSRSVALLQEWLALEGFSDNYALTITSSGIKLTGNRYTDPKVQEVFEECTLAVVPTLEDFFHFPAEVTTSTGQAVYLSKTLKRTRMSVKLRLRYLYELGLIVTCEMTTEEQVNLRRILGWTKRQYADKIKTAVRVFRLYIICGVQRIKWTTCVTPHFIQHMKEADFARLLDDVCAYITLSSPDPPIIEDCETPEAYQDAPTSPSWDFVSLDK